MVARLPLAATTVVARGCIRGRRSANAVVFRVRYGPARDDIVDLGAGLSWRNNRQWLEAIRPYADIPRPDAALISSGPVRECLSGLSFGLEAEQRTRFRQLVE